MGRFPGLTEYVSLKSFEYVLALVLIFLVDGAAHFLVPIANGRIDRAPVAGRPERTLQLLQERGARLLDDGHDCPDGQLGNADGRDEPADAYKIAFDELKMKYSRIRNKPITASGYSYSL